MFDQIPLQSKKESQKDTEDSVSATSSTVMVILQKQSDLIHLEFNSPNFRLSEPERKGSGEIQIQTSDSERPSETHSRMLSQENRLSAFDLRSNLTLNF